MQHCLKLAFSFEEIIVYETAVYHSFFSSSDNFLITSAPLLDMSPLLLLYQIYARNKAVNPHEWRVPSMQATLENV